MNIQSIVKNKIQLELLAESKHPAMIFCSETCATDNILDSELKIEHYDLIRCDSTSRHTGGTLIYIKQSVKYVIIENRNYNNNTWCLTIEVKTKELKGNYTVIYHSPSTSDSSFIDILEQIVRLNVNLLKSCVILGDFNIDMSKHYTYSKRLQHFIEQAGLKQIVNFYTRVTPTSNTIIDLVVTNNEHISCQCLPNNKISDHETIKITLGSSQKQLQLKTQVTSWTNYNKHSLLSILQESQWNTFYNLSIDNKLTTLCYILRTAVSKLVTTKEIEKKKNPWFNDELKGLKREKNNLNQKAILTKKHDDFKKYIEIRNQYKKKTVEIRNKFVQNCVTKSSGNIKSMWKCLKTIINYKERPQVKVVKFNNVLYTDEQEIANHFNDYFINSVADIYNSIPTVPLQNSTQHMVNTQFEFKLINLDYLQTIVSKLKNKSSKDLITTKVLKDSFDLIGYFLVMIINESFKNSIVPLAWKCSSITPIPKVKNTCNCNEFRPINVLPIHEKLLECTVHDQLLEYINTNDVLIATQSGFRSNHSCETSLNLVLATWKEDIDNGNSIIAVFLDFKRAFETIDRYILLHKLANIGIGPNAIKWFKDYLTDRMQATEFNGKTSKSIVNPYGVPQGSVLGPLLFILYINDIHKSIKHCKLNLFADDTLLTIASKNIEDATQKLNQDLCSLSKWLEQNKLKLNVSKTKYMFIGKKTVNRTTPVIHINSEYIEIVNSFKYLGIIIDNKLNFHEHIQHIIKQIAKKIGVLYRASKQLTKHAIQTIYNTIIKPHFQYCSTILFLCTNTDIRKLQVQQNKVMRLILKCPYDTHIKNMLIELKWLSVRQIIYYNVFLFIYKMQNNMLPLYLCNNIKYIYQHHNINTRNRNHIYVHSRHKSSTQNSLYYKGFTMYNSLPTSLKQSTLSQFKIKIKNYVSSQLNYE